MTSQSFVAFACESSQTSVTLSLLLSVRRKAPLKPLRTQRGTSNNNPARTTQPGSAPKSPEFGNLMSVLSPVLSQNSSQDLTELLNTEPLDTTGIDPQSWDSLYHSVAAMSPVLSRRLKLKDKENCAPSRKGSEDDALVQECYSRLQTQPAGKILDSMSDSGIGDNSGLTGSDEELKLSREGGPNETTDAKNESEPNSRVRYPKRQVDRINYTELEVPEEDAYICECT